MGITAGVLGGAGLLTSLFGSAQESKAIKAAGEINAANLEYNAEQAKIQAAEEERVFRQTFKREEAGNIAQLGAAGVKLQGSALAAIKDNARMAEEDAIKIRKGGEIKSREFKRQARLERMGARNAASAAEIGGVASVFSGASRLIGGA